MMDEASEVSGKLAGIRAILVAHGLAGVRLRGVDWFSWVTGGASSVVILTNEIGVAEVLVTAAGAWVLTDVIERARIFGEELSPEAQAALPIHAVPWQTPAAFDEFVAAQTGKGVVASDRSRPGSSERPLPAELVALKRRLGAPEIARYRELGAQAARAMTLALQDARPDWTEQRLAGRGAELLWERGIHPTLVLVAGERRAETVRHPLPTPALLGRKAMLVFCARRHGLYACFTRWVCFGTPLTEDRQRLETLAGIESRALAASKPGARLGQISGELARAYADAGCPEEIDRHHQGGTTGYLSREAVARPDSREELEDATALAWNPSLPGAKLEDTMLMQDGQFEILTHDPEWPTFARDGRSRPDFLVRP